MKVACLGDSITGGSSGGVLAAFPQRLETLLGPSHVVGNYGVAGNTISQIQTRWTSTVRSRGHTHLVLLGGLNDLRVGTAGATIYTTWSAIADEAKLDGLVVVAVTVLPWKNFLTQWTAARQTETEALNTSIRAWVSTTAVLVDGYALFGGADPTIMSASYDSGDNGHPNQAGADYLARLVLGAIT